MNFDSLAPDHRQPCKYGSGCYQNNPMHREKFKHPQEKEESTPEENQTPNRANTNTKTNTDLKEKEKETFPVKRKLSSDSWTEAGSSQEESASPEKKVKEVEKEEFGELLPPAPKDLQEHLKQKFLTPFPEDFFAFWEFCKERNPSCPQEALKADTGLSLVGPFDLLTKEDCPAKTSRNPDQLLSHWRFYYDVPEFQTVLADPDTHVHLGYFRDEPSAMPEFVAAADPKTKGCKLNPLGENLFGALYQHLTTMVRTAPDPFKITRLEKLKESVHVFATMKARLALDAKTPRMRARDKLRKSATLHGAGMVVPFDKANDLGYRPIPETTASLKKKLAAVVEDAPKAMDDIYELITNVQFANDEGDPGMGLELGLDAFCFGGSRLTGPVRQLLGMGYELVNRPEFGKIALAHLERRKEGEFFKVE